MKISLTKYIEKMEDIYIKAREDWEKVQKELQEEDERYNKIEWDKLSQKGIQEKHEEHYSRKKECENKVEAIRRGLIESFDKIIADSDKVFNHCYEYTISEVDSNGVAILQNGSLRPRELMKLAESYFEKGNYTMYFMISEKLNPEFLSEDKYPQEEIRTARAYYNESQRRRSTREDHELFNNMKEVCLSGLRPEDYLSNGIHKEHAYFYNNILKDAESIVSENPSPWD